MPDEFRKIKKTVLIKLILLYNSLLKLFAFTAILNNSKLKP